jgi:hypothetical protein
MDDGAELSIDPDMIEQILEEKATAKKQRRRRRRPRQRLDEPFAPIPYDRARKLFHHIGGPAWLLLIEIDRLILEGGGRNPVRLTTEALQESGLARWEKGRGLRLLEQAKVITVERKRGCCPLVTHLWYPVQT